MTGMQAQGHDRHRAGRVAVIGRPNVGKSTFFNRVLGQKLSITSPRPQTTRYVLVGIQTRADAQIIYVDTPGLQARAGRGLNRAMNREIARVLPDVDVVLMLCEALRWRPEDDYVREQARASGAPVVLAVNKIDRLADRRALLPFLARCADGGDFADIVPVSTRTDDNLAQLEDVLVTHLPLGEAQYPDDQVTDRSERFFAAEFLREKLTRLLGAELPYSVGVVVEGFERREHLIHITALIWVERPGQKRIVVGRGGEVLKRAGELARKDMEQLFGMRVFLETWVKVREDWADDTRSLRELGFS